MNRKEVVIYWLDDIGRKDKSKIVKIISKLSIEIIPSIETQCHYLLME